MNLLLKKQNDSELIKLLKASTVAYHKAKYWEIRITYFLIALAFAYPVSYIIVQNEKIKLLLFGCSFGLTIFVQLFYDTFKGNTSKGAIFKEEFDVILFQLPWKSTFQKPDHKDVSKFSIQYKGAAIVNWYDTNLSENIPIDVAIAVCQHSNTGWDIDLRKNYLAWLKGFLIFYTIGLSVFFVVMDVKAVTIFSIGFSILSFYTHFLTLIRGHTAVIKKREAISQKLDDIILYRKAATMGELRDIQDEIYITRQEPAKVPNFFFRLYKNRLSQQFDDYVQSVNKIYS